ncbi:MAG: twin-arginine translocation signal domain-containing protein [Verrucomicrobia bacterium]|nr:twin-arginine translocation signal domain-containing protein [Verrucomicrobiota bacterium]
MNELNQPPRISRRGFVGTAGAGLLATGLPRPAPAARPKVSGRNLQRGA